MGIDLDIILNNGNAGFDRQAGGAPGSFAIDPSTGGALLGGSLGLGSTLLLDLWVLPALLGQPFLRLFLLAEHSGCPQTDDMLVNSRTTQTSKPLQWLCWNMNRHSAHHAYPALPFHALPAADRLLADQTKTRANGYLAVHREILAGLRRNPADVSPLI